LDNENVFNYLKRLNLNLIDLTNLSFSQMFNFAQ
jgi:hypothetical protein